MSTDRRPPGLPTDPSSWSRRAPLIGLGLAGAAVATYLSLYQLGALKDVWDPIFGTGSERVISSTVSRALPIPDATLGVLAYLLDAALAAIGGQRRWRTAPWLVVADGLVVLGLVLTGLALTATQLFIFHVGCTLCLVSAAISFSSGLLARDEVVAAVDHLRGPSSRRPSRDRPTPPPAGENAERRGRMNRRDERRSSTREAFRNLHTEDHKE